MSATVRAVRPSSQPFGRISGAPAAKCAEQAEDLGPGNDDKAVKGPGEAAVLVVPPRSVGIVIGVQGCDPPDLRLLVKGVQKVLNGTAHHGMRRRAVQFFERLRPWPVASADDVGVRRSASNARPKPPSSFW